MMRLSHGPVFVLCGMFLSACSANGVLGLNPQPAGNITVVTADTGTPIQFTKANPYLVTGGAFSIGIREDNFSGPYIVNVIAWTAPFNTPCFVPHQVDSSNKTNIVLFTADNAAPVATPNQPSPCIRGGDEETAQITDGRGHALNFYYSIAP